MPAIETHGASINLAWLVKLRWGAITGQAATIAIAALVLGEHLPLALLYGVVAVELVSNLVAGRWAQRERVGEHVSGIILTLDVVLLTLLLAMSGGSSNPFNFLYLVYIALAAVIVQPRWAWSLVALSAACFGALFFIDDGGHGGHGDMAMHLRGMWVGFCVAAVFIAYFVQRVYTALREREAQLAQARRVASLATLSAGAAHELSTPLSTIAVVAKELERSLGADETHREDVELIRSQVQRCRTILDQMATDAGASTGEAIEPVAIGRIIEQAVESLRERDRVEAVIPPDLSADSLAVPARAFSRALRALVKNALEASSGKVTIQAQRSKQVYSIEVHDHGDGIPPDVLEKVGDPFFTTKPPGRGMGLGVFLARAVTESLGGGLTIESTPGRGTCARLTLGADRG